MNWAWLIPGYLAIVLHEMAHARVAYISGDWTGKVMGRVTLNPLKHMEWLGTVIMPLCTMLLIGLPLGWAKPVPVNFALLTGLQRIRVALAGPFCNLLQAGAWAAVIVVTTALEADVEWLNHIASAGVLINVLLFAINMLPLVPLDGAHVLQVLLPPRAARAMVRYEWAQMLLLALLLGLAARWWRQ